LSETSTSIVILMADDDPDDRELAQAALRESRLANELHFVEDGEQLLAYLRNQPPYEDAARHPQPGLILLDLNMPKMDGREALAAIKGDPGLRHLPVVVLTTSRAEEDILRIVRRPLRRGPVDLLPVLEEPPESVGVPGKRPVRAPDAFPGVVDVDLDQNRVRVGGESLTRLLREHGSAAEGDHGRRPGESLRDDLLLEATKLGLPALEELRDRPVQTLDLLVGVHEGTSRALGDVAPDRRLPSPHEADEGEVLT